MTLVLILGNSEQSIQISDRRLTSFGKIVDDESNKAGILTCANARLSYGFTGLARTTNFETRAWLNSSLAQCAPPDYFAKELIERFARKATQDFQTLSSLRHLMPAQKALAIIFSGYLYHHDPPLAAYAIVSNFQSHSRVPKYWQDFKPFFWSETRPIKDEISWVERVGIFPAMFPEDISTFRTLLKNKKPARAILGKAVELMNEISARKEAKSTIGKQLTSIILPRDGSKDAETGYHSELIRHKVYMPSMINVTGPDLHCVVDNVSVEAVTPEDTPPMVVPKVPQNRPCPCNSGKKYKRCHGKPAK